MGNSLLKALAWGFGVGLYLRYGLEPTGWLFYEASHALGIDSLYWGYTVLRGGAWAFGLWAYQALACVGAGLLVAMAIMLLNRRREG